MWINSIIDSMGNTPLIALNRMNPNPEVTILVKCEGFNPGGSVKARPALAMIESLEKSGELTRFRTIIEATSGNTGIGLAMVAAVKGYQIALVMPETASVERQRILRAYGAELILTDGTLGTDGAIEEAYRLAREYPEKYLLIDQFNNENNPLSHYNTTAPELISQTDGKITAFVATLGTGGTLMGVSRKLKEFNKDIQCIGVEPYFGHKIQGLKNMKESYRPEIFHRDEIDEIMHVEDADAFSFARRLAREEGILAGMSSGAAVWAACEAAKKMEKGIIVTILPDTGERYLSTELFSFSPPVDFRLYDTLQKQRVSPEPKEKGCFSVYTCGPTLDGLIGLSDARRFVAADVLKKHLIYKGFRVKHIINITDIDDRTMGAAQHENITLGQLFEKYFSFFQEDMKALRIMDADLYPRASEHVPEMEKIAEILVNKGVAYEKFRSIYFDISKFERYGKLSGVDLNKIRHGITVDLDSYEKQNPRDFTLFKRAKLSELKQGSYYKTQWGNCIPGWHIECAAIVNRYFGGYVDIHTGSTHLVFPHNENEIAIAESANGSKYCGLWFHNGPVLVNKSMESYTNRFILRQLFKTFSAETVRYWLMQAEFKKAVEFSREKISESGRALDRLNNFIFMLNQCEPSGENETVSELLSELRNRFDREMSENLNVGAAIGHMHYFVNKVMQYIIKSQLSLRQKAAILCFFKQADCILEIFDFNVLLPENILNLMKRRWKLRKNKDFEGADCLKTEIWNSGYDIMDGSGQSFAIKKDRS